MIKVSIYQGSTGEPAAGRSGWPSENQTHSFDLMTILQRVPTTAISVEACLAGPNMTTTRSTTTTFCVLFTVLQLRLVRLILLDRRIAADPLQASNLVLTASLEQYGPAGLARGTDHHLPSVGQLSHSLSNPHHPTKRPSHPTTTIDQQQQQPFSVDQPATVANSSTITSTTSSPLYITAYHHHLNITTQPHPPPQKKKNKHPAILYSIHLITLAQLPSPPPALSIEFRSGLVTYYYDWSDREVRKAFHQLLHHYSIHSPPSSTIEPKKSTRTSMSTDSSRPSSPANSHTTTTSPRLTRPTLNVTPAEPVLSRPNLPRSASAIEPFSSSSLLLHPPSSPDHIRRRLASLAGDQQASKSSTPPLSSSRPPPFLIHHQRSRSAQPSLAIISPISIALSCPQSDSAEALLQRALDEDEDARSWADHPDPDHLLIDLPDSIPPPPPPATNDPLHPHGFAHLRMDPVLADLEAKSRLNVQTECAICQKKGINYPKCPKCQLEFCSRSCRVSMGDGERHKCA
ncbi:hypothetical protein PGT21_035344 [Puccinia graminis f. sp. tritici]|uniref:Uncharacterized protein n=1 Tax=Puccinia graminis f. sp. tritici TaxID=56615 RepID=A0A5B0PN04_PUCGR|nr:hypothetical protein PGT21_035344 [Puccinia graminis f. sp. tritici]